jgi:hypothetical protein
MIRGDGDREALEKKRYLVQNRSPKRKNCGFDVTGPDKLTLPWHIKKKPLFLVTSGLLL